MGTSSLMPGLDPGTQIEAARQMESLGPRVKPGDEDIDVGMIVMAGLGPAIHAFIDRKVVDARIKSGHDGVSVGGTR